VKEDDVVQDQVRMTGQGRTVQKDSIKPESKPERTTKR